MVCPILQTLTSILIVVNHFWTHQFSPLAYQFFRILFWRVVDGQEPFVISVEDHNSPLLKKLFGIW